MVINAMGTDPDEAKITREDHPRIESAPDADPSEQPKRSNFSTRNVLVVYGRDELLRRDLFVFLRTVGLNPLEFEEIVQQTGTASPYVLDALKLAFTNVQACVVLFSPDETVQLRPHLRSSHDPEGAELQPRPNVLVEAGMAMALQPARTILVRVGKVRSFSDFDGKHYVNLTGTAESRNKLVGKLRVAGCDPRTADDDWLTVGNFKPSGEDQI
jgi:predicted nucleotide-binding protein